MKLPLYSILILFFLLLSCKFMDKKTDVLAQYQWKNRIVVIFSENKENDIFKKQIQLFLENKEELKERDLVIFQVFKNEGRNPNQKIISNSDIELLQKRFDFHFDTENKNNFAVFLVGKDGGTKLKTENKTLNIENLFGVIDAMPMRQSEIKR
ncbi:DUF4174 domain-containing protein [Bernardetia litoralis]|nr:DUF4174 domain-containing protein [Bernardetia litoralis]